MTALVTGAAGLLGGHMVDALVERGERVRAFVRADDDGARLARLGVDVRRGDLRDRAAVRAAVAGVEVVHHCAARTGPWGPEADHRAVNVYALKALVDAALAAGVRRILHVSSITVHGNDIGGSAGEDARLRQEPNPYSRSKVAGERMLGRLIAERGAPITIVRPGWMYGPRDTASFARFAAMIERGRMVVIGDGDNHVPLIYARDVAEGMALAGATPQAAGRVYLLVNDEPVTQRHYLDAIANALGVDAPRRRIPYRVALALGAAAEWAGHVTRRAQPPPLMRYGVQLLGGENRFDITRARRELGFAPRTSLVEGVRLSVAWYRGERTAPSDASEAGGAEKQRARAATRA